MSTVFYQEILYPFQNKVLKAAEPYIENFYLTGGTALNRGYYPIRYSDDLDFFCNDSSTFIKESENVIDSIISNGIDYDKNNLTVTENYIAIQLMIPHTDQTMKIDFVNDVPVHFGKVCKTLFCSYTDSIENILTNKMSALVGRFEIKDAVDLWTISKNNNFNWAEVIEKSQEKEANIDTVLITEELLSITNKQLDSIKWITKPDYIEFFQNIKTICKDMLRMDINTLCQTN